MPTEQEHIERDIERNVKNSPRCSKKEEHATGL